MRPRTATPSNVPAFAWVRGPWMRPAGWMPVPLREEDLDSLARLVEGTNGREAGRLSDIRMVREATT